MSETIVETSYGKVRGDTSGPVSVWKGIPYARPPLGKLRFRLPQSPEPWPGVRDATRFGPIAPQDIPHLQSLTQALSSSAEPQTGNEDCLYLNIWSPGTDDRKRPVMVWIHGGAFIIGSGSQPDYDGAGFASQGDVVVVTLNYRLGLLGFLYLAELTGAEYLSSGNCGLFDQIAALQWIRENIAAFGGDPENITIFGESAGAMSIGMLLTMPAARGLFKRAILESGAADSMRSIEDATRMTREFLKELKIAPDRLDDLVDVPIKTFLTAQATVLARNPLGGVRPVADGRDIPIKPLQALAEGSAQDVVVLIGTNRDEMKLFAPESSTSAMDPTIAQKVFGNRAIEIFTTYAMLRPGADMQAIGLDMFTDYMFRIPAIRLAEQQAEQGVSVWMYRFDWPSPNRQFGACHALEMPFVWNILDRSSFRTLLGDRPPTKLARAMHAAWIAFARTGDPNTPELPAWPVYDLERRTTMLFNEQCATVDDPQGVERAVWKDPSA